MTHRALSLIVGLSFTILMVLSSPKKVYSAFSITSISPQSINNPDEVITLTASGSSLLNKQQYLQVGITFDSSVKNYFGLINSKDNSWFSYKSTITDSDLPTMFTFTPLNGSWSGELKAKIDVDDSGFKGPGNYLVRLNRYITTSANTTDFVNLNINYSKPVIVEPPPSPVVETVSVAVPQTESAVTESAVSPKQSQTTSTQVQTNTPKVLGKSTIASNSAQEFVATVNLGLVKISSSIAQQSQTLQKNEEIKKDITPENKKSGFPWYVFVVPAVGLIFVLVGLLKYTHEYFKQRSK